MFTTARVQQVALKLGLYGRAGAGKTFTALLLAEGLAKKYGGRIAVIDTEHGTDFYARTIAERKVHPDGFDFDVLHTRSLTEALKAIQSLDKKYSVVIVDSISHLWDMAVAAYTSRTGKNEQIPFHAWEAIKRPFKQLIMALMNSNAHVIICGREKYEYKYENGELVVIGTAMRAERETMYEPHIVIRLTNDGVVRAFVEKDRTGILAGQTIEWPNYENICNKLEKALGGNEQAKLHDDELVSMYDAEVITAEENKRAQEAGNAFRYAMQLIEDAMNTAELEYAGKEISRCRFVISADDIVKLREAYSTKMRRLKYQENGQCVR